MGAFTTNANACSTEHCNYSSDCNNYAKERCKTYGATCEGAWDEDPFKSGKQGCHGTCYCKPPPSVSPKPVEDIDSTTKPVSKPHHPRQDVHDRLRR